MKSYIYICVMALLCAPLPAAAQQAGVKLAARSVAVENLQVRRADGSLGLELDLRLDSLQLPSNRRFVFTPIVRSGDEERILPRIVLNGRRQDISFRRTGYRDFAETDVVVRRDNGTPQSLHYTASLPLEAWMQNANVVIEEDLCGCGNVLDSTATVLRRLRTPVIAYIHPKAEARKERQEEGRAFIDFPVNKTTLYPDYRNNPRELDKILSTIRVVKEDANTTITGVEIHGFASPESPYSHNAYLANGRAITLKDYVKRLSELDEQVFSVKSTPEDWDGLRAAVAASSLDNRDQILALIDEPGLDPDRREQLIKTRYPDDYRLMLTTWYPALRHSDYVVRYSVRPFSVEEAKALLRTKPQQLSLEEMYLVAQTYAPGSEAFNEVFDVAVRMFPDDPQANLNAACAALERGDNEAALRYLDKAGQSPYAAHARGVMAMRDGREAEARRLFEEAAQGGVPEARRNLELLDMP